MGNSGDDVVEEPEVDYSYGTISEFEGYLQWRLNEWGDLGDGNFQRRRHRCSG